MFSTKGLDWIHGHTGYTYGQTNINSKSSSCVFLNWTHKTNGQTKQNRKRKSYGQTKYSFKD